jgi:hypothetical protein
VDDKERTRFTNQPKTFAEPAATLIYAKKANEALNKIAAIGSPRPVVLEKNLGAFPVSERPSVVGLLMVKLRSFTNALTEGSGACVKVTRGSGPSRR